MTHTENHTSQTYSYDELCELSGLSADDIYALTADLDICREYEVSKGRYSADLLDLLIRQAREAPPRFVGLVTDQTPKSLLYDDYRGYVEIDGLTGKWLRNLTEAEHQALDLGRPVRSAEYADLRQVIA